MCGISSFGWLIIHLVGAGKSKIVNISIQFYINILTFGGIKSRCLNVRLLIIMPAESVSKQARLIGCLRCSSSTSKIFTLVQLLLSRYIHLLFVNTCVLFYFIFRLIIFIMGLGLGLLIGWDRGWGGSCHHGGLLPGDMWMLNKGGFSCKLFTCLFIYFTSTLCYVYISVCT